MEEFETTTGNDDLLKELGLLPDGEQSRKRRLPSVTGTRYMSHRADSLTYRGWQGTGERHIGKPNGYSGNRYLSHIKEQ